MAHTDGLVGRRNSWNKEERLSFWGVPGRTLPDVVGGIHNGSPRLEMPPSPSPSPRACWQPRRTNSSYSHSSSSGPAQSTPSSYRATLYIVPKREVKEEPEYATFGSVAATTTTSPSIMYNFHHYFDPFGCRKYY
jgi:hypothetical protein